LIRTYRFRLRPSRAQHARLRAALEYSRQLYNAALQERIECYRKTGEGRSYFDQCQALTELRQSGSPWAAGMERAPLQAVARAYAAFFRRGGFPRFKGTDWFKSLGWSDKDGWKLENGKFYGKGLGHISVCQHRDLPSPPKAARIKREGRHWYVLLGCEVEAPEAASGDAVGIDLGLSTFAALSDGTLIPNPRRSGRRQAEMRRRQRALERSKKGSARRTKVKAALAAAHMRVRRARRTDQFQIAAKLTRQFSLIAVEDLNVRELYT
jgi:putative transposase